MTKQWRWRVLNRHYGFRNMGMEVFVKTPVIGTVVNNFIKRNKILQLKHFDII